MTRTDRPEPGKLHTPHPYPRAAPAQSGAPTRERLLCTTRADEPSIPPNRHAAPLPLLDHLGVCPLDQRAGTSERPARPVGASKIHTLIKLLAVHAVQDLLP